MADLGRYELSSLYINLCRELFYFMKTYVIASAITKNEDKYFIAKKDIKDISYFVDIIKSEI